MPVRYTVLLADASVDAVEAASLHLRAPLECAEVALHVARHGTELADLDALSADRVVDLLQRVDAFRRAERFDRMLEAVAALAVDTEAAHRAVKHWRTALAAANGVDAGTIAKAHRGHESTAIRAARIAAVSGVLRR